MDSDTVKVIRGDLFDNAQGTSLAHCVSADLKMGKGIAVQFKRRFGQLKELSEQNQGVGGCAWIKVQERIIFYLVTKSKYWHKPSEDSIRAALKSMRHIAEREEVTEISMPKIACGLDQKKWQDIYPLIVECFKDSGITIYVYIL